MSETQIIGALSDASLAVIGGAIVVIFLLRLSGIIQAVERVVHEWNSGQKERSDALAEMQTQTIRAATDAFEKAMSAVTASMAESREFYVARLNEALQGNHTLEARIQTLEDQLKERDRRIRELEAQVQRLTESLLAAAAGKKTRGADRETTHQAERVAERTGAGAQSGRLSD